MELMYEPELDVDRRWSVASSFVIAIEALTDYESGAYEGTPRPHTEQARSAWIHAIDRLLPTTPAAA